MMKQRLTRRVTWIYAAALFLSLHYAFTVYINSNFLVQYFSQSEVSLLYTIGSAITIIFFIASPSLVRKFGNGRVLLTAIFLEATALFGIYMSQNSTAIATFFICIQALPPLLLFGLDVFLEDTLRSEKTTGRVRSMYLTIINFAFLLSPLIVGSIVQNYSYKVIYLIAAGFCFFLFFVV
ncbi:MAG TPA: MFS transporter, partial [Candidatus Babeliales bacterium]|nr:MFS transporter [Candidatus Babeliales bacterium]